MKALKSVSLPVLVFGLIVVSASTSMATESVEGQSTGANEVTAIKTDTSTAKSRFEAIRKESISQSCFSCVGRDVQVMVMPGGKIVGYLAKTAISYRATQTVQDGMFGWADAAKNYALKIEPRDDKKHDSTWELYGELKTTKDVQQLVCHQNPTGGNCGDNLVSSLN